MERVIAMEGEAPVLIVAPHGCEQDDSNTAFIAERMAKELNAFVVVNQGWARDSQVNYLRGRANCNDVRHIHEDVVKEEFLDPILKYITIIENDFGFANLMIIHGVGNQIRKYADDLALDIIVGFGAGNPPVHSCEPRMKDAFIHYLEKAGVRAYEGKPGGQYSGRVKTNLNQLYRRWYPNTNVHSMQIEIVKELREDRDISELTALTLADCVDSLIYLDDTENIPTNKRMI